MEMLKKILNDLAQRLDKLENNLVINKITIPASGYFVPKVLSSDPSTPAANEVWINSTTNQLKWNKAGTIKTITFT